MEKEPLGKEVLICVSSEDPFGGYPYLPSHVSNTSEAKWEKMSLPFWEWLGLEIN